MADARIPKTTKQWKVTGYDGFGSLQLTEEPVPEIGDSEVLVKILGVSLNFRDIIIPLGKYPFNQKPNVVPGSDGAGIVLAVGKNVTRFRPGNEVVTILNQKHLAGSLDSESADSGLGGSIDGTLRSIGAFNEQGLVRKPAGLSFLEAATLTCAGVTAWNALCGLPGKQLMAGQWLLTQGTGGVSIFAIQFAKAIGARVIATTSSTEKSKLLQRLGADHIINYREVSKWGETAKALTGGVGVELVVEVAGAATMRQSAASLKPDGTMSVVGFVGGEDKTAEIPTLLDTWLNYYTARGIAVGSRLQMEDMCRFIEGNTDRLRAVLDSRVFKLEEVKEAYKYLQAGENLGKVCISLE
ncbi:zinc-binding oxidoreductase [Lipomyces tetrasporus]|uniref:Zinc-binding oxidoreductase n=1 Tax=Lipomyces tetrasporus TaxID=54092 RepID=A0AAD7QTP3_9ASCO|nr:zinc-binding oxidoreductase [Lipomyces tetrasporus]KAJ8100806.1 zinc-binding oxidoreductase [Lipomyces tetrasporus]